MPVAEVEQPTTIGRLWQRGTLGWTGNWTVTLDDGPHGLMTILKMGLTGNRVTIFADGQKIDSGGVFAFIGEIRKFRWRGHAFVLRVKGLGLSGELALAMDGTELTPDSAAPVGATPVAVVPKAAPVQAAGGHVPAIPRLEREIDVLESDEVVGIEEYPLDNTFGDLALTTDRQISKAITNECSVETSGQVSGSVNAQILSVIKAEVAAELAKKTGAKVGETVTESQTLHLSVGPKSAVLYRVLWKRRVRAGQRVYAVESGEITVPYRLTYGLSCEVQSQELKPQV